MKARPAPVVSWIVLGLLLVGWSVPALGVFVDSVRPAPGGAERGWWTVVTSPEFTLEHYRTVLAGVGRAGGMWDGFLGSVAIALPATVLPVLFGAAAAYAFAWIPFRGRTGLYLVVVGLAVVPVQMTLIPLFSAFTDLGLAGEWASLWLAHSAFGLPIAVLLLRNAIGAVPAHLVDAARIDGARHLDAFWRVALPLSIPALTAVATLQFLLVWNDYLLAATFLAGSDSSTAPLTLVLAELARTHGQDQHLLGAGTIVTVVVPLVVYFSLQRLVISATRVATFDD